MLLSAQDKYSEVRRSRKWVEFKHLAIFLVCYLLVSWGSDGAGVFCFIFFNKMYTLKTCMYIIWGFCQCGDKRNM